jgi:hypothetical protein
MSKLSAFPRAAALMGVLAATEACTTTPAETPNPRPLEQRIDDGRQQSAETLVSNIRSWRNEVTNRCYDVGFNLGFTATSGLAEVECGERHERYVPENDIEEGRLKMARELIASLKIVRTKTGECFGVAFPAANPLRPHGPIPVTCPQPQRVSKQEDPLVPSWVGPDGKLNPKKAIIP